MKDSMNAVRFTEPFRDDGMFDWDVSSVADGAKATMRTVAYVALHGAPEARTTGMTRFTEFRTLGRGLIRLFVGAFWGTVAGPS